MRLSVLPTSSLGVEGSHFLLNRSGSKSRWVTLNPADLIVVVKVDPILGLGETGLCLEGDEGSFETPGYPGVENSVRGG